jgi:hypothetical protein
VYMVQIEEARDPSLYHGRLHHSAMILRPIAGRLVDRRGRSDQVLGLFSALLIPCCIGLRPMSRRCW